MMPATETSLQVLENWSMILLNNSWSPQQENWEDQEGLLLWFEVLRPSSMEEDDLRPSKTEVGSSSIRMVSCDTVHTKEIKE